MKHFYFLALSLCSVALITSCNNQNRDDSKDNANAIIQQMVDNSNPRIKAWIDHANTSKNVPNLAKELSFLEALNLGGDGLWIKYEANEVARSISEIKSMGIAQGQEYWGMLLDSWSFEEDFWKMAIDENVPQVVMALKGSKSGEIVSITYSNEAFNQIFSYLKK